MADEGSSLRRLASLDVLRGLTLVGMICVNYSDDLQDAGFRVFPLLLHARWAGFTIADSVFPAFLLMSGVSIPLAIRSRGFTREAGRRLLIRSLRLVLIGLFVSNAGWLLSPATQIFRPLGVLQRIGVAYFVAAWLFHVAGPRVRLGVAIGLLLLYWLALLLPFPDGTTDLLVHGANASSWIDRALLGAHVYETAPLAFDPEGLLGNVPAIAQALIGVAVGEWVLARRPAGPLALAGLCMVAAGLLWNPFLPIVKAVWSSSYVLLSSGVAILALSLFYALMDRRGMPMKWTRFFSDFGVNSIFAYVLHQIFAPLLKAPVFRGIYAAAGPFVGNEVASLLPIAIVCALMALVLRYMRRHGWIVKI